MVLTICLMRNPKVHQVISELFVIKSSKTDIQSSQPIFYFQSLVHSSCGHKNDNSVHGVNNVLS